MDVLADELWGKDGLGNWPETCATGQLPVSCSRTVRRHQVMVADADALSGASSDSTESVLVDAGRSEQGR